MSYDVGDVYYGNDLNPYNGRYQAVHVMWAASTSDATAATPDTTEVLFNPCALQKAEILDVLVYYPAASGSVTTEAALWLYKYLVNNATPERQGTLVVNTEASQTIRTVREYSAATTNTTSTTGGDRYTYPTLNLGEVVRLLYKTAGVGGTQSVLFGIRYRERPVSPVGPTVTTAGSITDKTWP